MKHKMKVRHAYYEWVIEKCLENGIHVDPETRLRFRTYAMASPKQKNRINNFYK